MKVNNKYIGCNFTGYAYIGGVDSAFNGPFKDEEVLIGSGFDYVPCMMGNITEAYELLKENIKNKDAHTFEEICECIYQTVDTYFGGIKNISSRMSYYKDLDDITSEEDITKVSTLKGKGAAMCVERAMLSQNLLISVGIKSTYKTSGINKDGKKEIHAYNLIENDSKYYIFDSSIPTEKNGKTSPLIGEIPKEVYDKITSPKREIGYSINVSHYNPLRNKDVKITYDANRKDSYTIENKDIKVK